MIKSRQLLGALCVLGAAVACSGCATTQDLDAKFAAGWRPSKSYCVWGGETETLEAYCAELKSGPVAETITTGSIEAEFFGE